MKEKVLTAEVRCNHARESLNQAREFLAKIRSNKKRIKKILEMEALIHFVRDRPFWHGGRINISPNKEEGGSTSDELIITAGSNDITRFTTLDWRRRIARTPDSNSTFASSVPPDQLRGGTILLSTPSSNLCIK